LLPQPRPDPLLLIADDTLPLQLLRGLHWTDITLHLPVILQLIPRTITLLLFPAETDRTCSQGLFTLLLCNPSVCVPYSWPKQANAAGDMYIYHTTFTHVPLLLPTVPITLHIVCCCVLPTMPHHTHLLRLLLPCSPVVLLPSHHITLCVPHITIVIYIYSLQCPTWRYTIPSCGTTGGTIYTPITYIYHITYTVTFTYTTVIYSVVILVVTGWIPAIVTPDPLLIPDFGHRLLPYITHSWDYIPTFVITDW